MAVVPSPIYWVFTQQLHSQQTLSIFHQFFDFHTRVHPIWLSPPIQGCHHPPPLIGQTSHPPAGPSATPCSIPHRFYQFLLISHPIHPSVHLTHIHPPIHQLCPDSIHPSTPLLSPPIFLALNPSSPLPP